ncbi:hypothetical protein HPB52_024277 [Rhipicephalus sanguineus]|uniref:Uncharacterized protein n=1 Tax=Rhipicephalus sanguineus TaxID=34632 RepID=A0A9D4P9H7_RHISA|nr:hypothetical protein HPB52_024277 [Rhipicephalus sanguineus]
MRSNVPSSTPEEYFVVVFSFHFSKLSQNKSMRDSLLPSNDDENAMRILCESYHSDVGDFVSSAVWELHLWYRKLQRLEKRPMGPLKALESCPPGSFWLGSEYHQEIIHIMEDPDPAQKLKPFLKDAIIMC